MKRDESLLQKAYQHIEEKKELVNEDYYRLNYHIMPPVGLLNDPNGFIQINGEYHLFYQFHPFDITHGVKYWGHRKSSNLVNWEELSIALAPGQFYESHGCYSGSAVNDNGTFTLIYTGNVKDEVGRRDTYQCLAVTDDGINFRKLGPVMKNQPSGYTRHFRDPKVWKKDGYWYMVIGTQTIQEEGRVLLFKSQTLKEWDLVGEVAGSNLGGLNDFGYMWECPDLFRLGNRDILIALPQGVEAEGDLYNNIYQAGYLVGELDYKSGRLEHGEFRELDRGFDFYAGQTTIDEKGRRILVAWMGLPDQEENYIERENGWVHALTIPRVLELGADDKLIQRPIEEMKELRGKQVSYQNVRIDNQEIELEGIKGDVIELILQFKLEDAEEFGVKIRSSKDGSQETVISYNLIEEKLSFNKNKSGRGEKGVRRSLISKKDRLRLHFFIDTSSVELFVNSGEEVFTSRIYPDKINDRIKFFAKSGSVKLERVDKWELEEQSITRVKRG